MLISKILKMKESKAKRRMKQAGRKKESHGGPRNGAANSAVHVGRAEVRDRIYRSLQCNKEEGRLLAALIEKPGFLGYVGLSEQYRQEESAKGLRMDEAGSKNRGKPERRQQP